MPDWLPAPKRANANLPSLPPIGYEVDLSARQGSPIGSLWKAGKQVHGATASEVAPGQWFTLEVIASGPHVRVLVDGKVVTDYRDPDRDYLKGDIALQQARTVRAGDDVVVRFRKIEIKNLAPSGSTSP